MFLTFWPVSERVFTVFHTAGHTDGSTKPARTVTTLGPEPGWEHILNILDIPGIITRTSLILTFLPIYERNGNIARPCSQSVHQQ